MSADIVAFPRARRDAPCNTRAQINAARRRGDCDASLWRRRAKREHLQASEALGDRVGSLEMGLIAAMLGSLNYAQALDTLRTAIAISERYPASPAAQQALAYLTSVFPSAAESAANVEAR